MDSGDYVNYIPHGSEFDIWRNRLSEGEYQALVTELRTRISGDEIHTSSWIPGADWTDTVFQPIYEKACRRDSDAAAKFFGLVLWVVLLEDEDVWGFGRYEKNGVPIEGMTYFKLEHPP